MIIVTRGSGDQTQGLAHAGGGSVPSLVRTEIFQLPKVGRAALEASEIDLLVIYWKL